MFRAGAVYEMTGNCVLLFEAAPQPNLTGTDGAYRPSGSLAKGGARPPATGDYQAWKPD